jgi:predicted Zn-dependent protease
MRKSEDFSNLLGSIIELGAAMSKAENRRDNLGLIGGSIKALYSREDEQEADALGAYIANKADYDPSRAIAFFARMMKSEQAANAQDDAQIAQAKAAAQQQLTNCESLKAQWNSSPKFKTPQNAQIVNNACQTAQNNAQQLNNALAQNTRGQLRSALLRSHPVDQDRMNALAASVQYLKGSRSLQSLSGIGQGYNVYVAMNLNQSGQTTRNPTMPGTTDICANELKARNLPPGAETSDFMAACSLSVLYGLDVQAKVTNCTQEANSRNFAEEAKSTKLPVNLARQIYVRNCLTDGKFDACGKEAESTNVVRGPGRAVFMRECLNRN